MFELVMLLLFLSLITWEGDASYCHMKDPLPVPHEWYQSGDLLVGEISSQMAYNLHEIDFSGHPAQELYKIP